MFKKLYIFFILWFIYGELNNNYVISPNLELKKPINLHELSFDEKRNLVFNEIIKNEIKHPNIVLAQSILESGNFKSYIFIKNNNLFGMKLPKSRNTTATGTNKGYAKYDTWEDSIKDYSLYQEKILKGRELSDENYLKFIGRKYAEEPEYVNLITKILSKNKF